MAFSSKPAVLSFLLFVAVVLPAAELTLAGRHLQDTNHGKSGHGEVAQSNKPKDTKSDEKQARTVHGGGGKADPATKQSDCFVGFGVHPVGVTVPTGSASVPAATGGQYLPASGGSGPTAGGQYMPGSNGGVVPSPTTTDGKGRDVDGVPAVTDGQGNGNGAPTGDSLPGADGSTPAGNPTRPRYLPGNDDTFVPNPGFEVPNPAYGTGP